MKFTEFEEFAKQRKKALRMNIDKKKEAEKKRNQDRQDNKMNKSLLEIYIYDSVSCGRQ